MQQLFHDHTAWQKTFPRLVSPLGDEWLPGLLLRCDDVNHWGSGMTMAHLFRSISSSLLRGKKEKPGWIVVPSSALEYMAQALAVPAGVLRGTTFQAELTSLYAPSGPHETQLGRVIAFRLCPACIAESHLLRRTFVLPHIHLCPYHEVELVSVCRCGVTLQLFSPYIQPFLCPGCGWEWAQLPLIPATPERFQTEQKVLSCCDFFFAQGTPQLLAHALQLIREKLKKERVAQVRLLDGTTKQLEHYELTKASLGYLVNLLVSLDLSRQLMEME